MTELKWVYGLDELSFGEIFDTKEEAIQSAIEEIKIYSEGQKSFLLANPEMHNPKIDIDFVIEELQQQAYDFADEHSAGWLEGIPKENKIQLEDDLNKVFTAWIIKNKYMPSFYRTQNELEWMPIPE